MRPLLLSFALAAAPALALAQAIGTDQATGTAEAGASGEAAQAGSPSALPPGTEMADGQIVFRNALTDKPLDMTYLPSQQITDAVTAFHRTGRNPYLDEEAAIASGKKIYAKLCAACHLPTGAGRIGPSLLDDEWRHPRLDTEVGRFEIIYGGGAGAMQAFGKRIAQDEILQVLAYIDMLHDAATSK